jgi:hypothetical protein
MKREKGRKKIIIYQIPSRVAVTLMDVEEPQLKQKLFENRQMHRDAFEEFFTAMAAIDDEPIDDELEAILSKRVNITRELDL